MTLRSILKVTEKYVIDNSPTLLSAFAVTGSVTVAYLTGKATFRAAEIINIEYTDRVRQAELSEIPVKVLPLDTKDKAKLVWKEYIPPALALTGTIGCIIFANSISTSRVAALAAAYKISEKQFAEYKDKALEKLGINKESEMRDEIAQARVDRHPSSGADILLPHNDVLCFDPYSGRYFRNDVETLRQAQNDLNEGMYRCSDSASLTDFYEKIGLSGTRFSDEVGWNTDHSLQLKLSTTLSDNNEPCLVIDFGITPFPIRNYHGCP